jgi:microcystin-dependent protein
MPFNGLGVFQSLPPPDYPAVPGEIIRAQNYNAVIDDIHQGLSNAMTRDGQTLPSGPLSMGGFPIHDLAPGQLPNDAATVAQLAAAGLDVGFGAPYFGGTIPTGWLLCDGRAVSRTTYATLYAKIGTRHGPGDGSTTFNLPDTRDRALIGIGSLGASGTPVGASEHALTVAEMPAHAHAGSTAVDTGHTHTEWTDRGFNTANGGQANANTNTGRQEETGVGHAAITLTIASEGEGAAFSLLPPSLVVGWLIKASNAAVTAGEGELDDRIQELEGTVAGLGSPNLTFNPRTGSYTFVLTDAGKNSVVVQATDATAQVFTIPLHVAVPFPVGCQIYIERAGVGALSVVGASGVTVQSSSDTPATPSLYRKSSSAVCIQKAIDVWLVAGELA